MYSQKKLDIIQAQNGWGIANPIQSSYPTISEYLRAHLGDNSDIITPKHIPKTLEAGKNTYVYDAHTYHTKVPPEAIKTIIKLFTKKGNTILDPFCGSGMTGIAARELKRIPILNDISPAAEFISRNYITPVNPVDYWLAIQQMLKMTKAEELFLYGTTCRECGKKVPVEYWVWSYKLICSNCNKKFTMWDSAQYIGPTIRESKILGKFNCPKCSEMLDKRKLKRTKIIPVEIGYRCCGSMQKEVNHKPSRDDLKAYNSLEKLGVPSALWYPKNILPIGVNTRQPISHGFKTIDSLYTIRNLRAYAQLWHIASNWKDEIMREKMLFTLTSLYKRITRLSEFRFWGGSSNTANLNVPHIMNEQNVFKTFERKARTIKLYYEHNSIDTITPYWTSCGSATNMCHIPDKSIDYIFTDPPFGGNIIYSDMNLIWESWLNSYTDKTCEAIIDPLQNKGILEYKQLMEKSLKEMNRVLKDEHWLTLVFHNSSANVWTALREAISSSGFVIVSTLILDKKHNTFKMFVNHNTVGFDVILNCIKNGSNGLNLSNDAHGEIQLERNGMNNDDTIRVQYSKYITDCIENKKDIELDFDKFRTKVVCNNHH